MTPENVIILTHDDAVAGAVAGAFNGQARSIVFTRCGGSDDISRRLGAGRPAAVVVDIDHERQSLLSELAALTGRFTDSCFVVVSSTSSEQLMLDSMAAGARHVLRKDQIASSLQSILERLLPRLGRQGSVEGAAFTVLSTAGGCGATTVAVNLAYEMYLAGKGPVLLVDMDTAYGGVGTCLNVRGEYGLASAMAAGKKIDRDLVRSSARPYADDLHVLVSPATVDFAAPQAVDFAHVPAAMAAFRQAYPVTVIDAPRVAAPAAAELALGSRAVLIVMQMRVKDVRMAHDLRGALLGGGVDPARIVPVVNRHRTKGATVTMDEVRRVMETDAVTVLANDFRRAARSFDLGEPLGKAAPFSPLRKDLRRFMEILTGDATA
ncbi:MAG: hypothetical protein ABFD92_18475 [Planctomycetaceae bacterium]|nr:hypothetical protein [Planctomycetaceae bacterium]